MIRFDVSVFDYLAALGGHCENPAAGDRGPFVFRVPTENLLDFIEETFPGSHVGIHPLLFDIARRVLSLDRPLEPVRVFPHLRKEHAVRRSGAGRFCAQQSVAVIPQSQADQQEHHALLGTGIDQSGDVARHAMESAQYHFVDVFRLKFLQQVLVQGEQRLANGVDQQAAQQRGYAHDQGRVDAMPDGEAEGEADGDPLGDALGLALGEALGLAEGECDVIQWAGEK